MKKLVLTLPVLALAACGQNYDKYDSIFDGCERIETTDVHLVYKCPATQEWAMNIKNTEPNGMFITGGDLQLAELYADTDHVYAEVAFNDNSCREGFTIRTMVAEPREDANWAVIGCR